MNSSITNEHNVGGGDVPLYRNTDPPQLPVSLYLSPNSELSRPRPPFGYAGNSGTFGMRSGIVSQSNLGTIPSVSTAIRSSTFNLSSIHDLQGSTGNYGLRRFLGDQGYMGAQNTKGTKPGTYDGTWSWSDYLIQLNLIADYYHWSDHDKALQLAIHLRGTAQVVLGDLS